MQERGGFDVASPQGRDSLLDGETSRRRKPLPYFLACHANTRPNLLAGISSRLVRKGKKRIDPHATNHSTLAPNREREHLSE